MPPRQTAPTPQDCLAAAEREFALGNMAADSERIGDAAVSAVRAVVQRRSGLATAMPSWSPPSIAWMRNRTAR